MKAIVQLSEDQIRQLRLIELEMLVEVDRICMKNNIDYSLDGGTLLGAVRHKGFIPWDDDLDVTFRHDQYEKFFEACKTDLDTSRFFMQDFRTDKGYRWGYGKLRRLGTEYVKSGQEHLKQKRGVCIDIFDYQYMPEDLKERKRFQRKMFCIRKIAYSAVGKWCDKNPLMRIWYGILSIIPLTPLHNSRLKELAKLNNIHSSLVSDEMYPTARTKNGVNSSVYDAYSEVEFEGMKFHCFENYDLYLSTLYGDYMTWPPVEKRVGVMDSLDYKLIDIKYEDILRQYKENHKIAD